MRHHTPLRRRVLAGGVAAAALLAPATVVATSFVAAPAAVAAPTDSSAATAAGTWLASQFTNGQYYVSSYTNKADPSTTADGLLGLIASGTGQATAKTVDAWLQTQAATATSAGVLAKLALVAEAMGDDPTKYGGVDLLTKITDAVTASGADLTGQYTGYTDALEIIALARGKATVPTVLLDGLVSQQQSDGSIASDADSTGLALVALDLVKSQPTAATALTKALAWAKANQQCTGYWESYSPVNTTGLIGSALLEQGIGVSTPVTWLVGQQQTAGGKGLPATIDDTSPDFYATAQGLLLLGGESLATVSIDGPTTTPTATANWTAACAASPSASASGSASATASSTPSSTATGTTAPTATSTWTTTAPTTQPLPATGDGGDLGDGAAWLLVGAGVSAAAGGVLLRGRRK